MKKGIVWQIISGMKLCFSCGWGICTAKVLVTVFSAVMLPLSFGFLEQLINTMTGGAIDLQVVVVQGAPYVACVFLSYLSGFLDSYFNLIFKRNLNRTLKQTVLNKLETIAFAKLEEDEVHSLLKRTCENLDESLALLFTNTMHLLSAVVSVLGFWLYFMGLSLWVGMLFAVLLWLSAVCLGKGAQIRVSLNRKMTVVQRKFHYLYELLLNKHSLFELKALRKEGAIAQKMMEGSRQVIAERSRLIKEEQRFTQYSILLQSLWGVIAVLFFAGALVKGNIATGVFVAVIGAIYNTIFKARDVAIYLSLLSQLSLQTVSDYNTMMELPQEQTERTQTLQPLQAFTVEFDKVSFRYSSEGPYIFENLSFSFCSTDHVALVGINGAGKSTIVKLLLKLYAPTSGQIRINGVDMEQLGADFVRSQFNVVFQDFFCYYISASDNIGVGDPAHLQDKDRIGALAAEYAVDKLSPAGMDTMLGNLEPGAMDISGGQWQRLCIARGAFKDAHFLVMDEPTSALDPVTEDTMYALLSEKYRSYGFLMISHRMASARFADKIIVLEQGKVVQEGSHGQLMAVDGLYKSLFQAQTHWYEESQ